MNTCQSCGNTYEGKYCNQCGEKVFHSSQNKFHHLVEEALHFFTHFDSKYLKTLSLQLKKPGQYTLDYCEGIRVKYYKPVSFLLLSIVIYILSPLKFDGLNNTLHSQLNNTGFSQLKLGWKTAHQALKGIDDAAYGILYKQKSAIVSKVLIFAWLPVWLMYISLLNAITRKRKTFFENLIALIELKSLHIWVGYLLTCILILPFILFTGEASTLIQTTGSIPFLIYCTLFFKRYFGLHTGIAVASGVILMALDFMLIPYYRLLLFYVANQLV